MSKNVTVLYAAKFLGVAPNTIRSWADNGTLRCRRHPVNNYRLLDMRGLKAMKKKIGV
jgi:predicted site-specific integrase-resolvase